MRPPVSPAIQEALSLAAPGWPTRADDSGIDVETLADGFRVVGPGMTQTADDPWEAAHWVLAAAIGSEAEDRAGRFVLNAGAVLVDDRAVLFAGESHAGKSSVALHLAALGMPLLGDDRLIVDADPPDAVGLGLARKIRTPLPPDFTDGARRLAASSRAGHAAGADVMARHPRIDRPAGTAAPVARIVVLERRPGTDTTRRYPLGAAAAVAALLPLCGRHAGSAADLLDSVATLVRRVPVERLQAPDSASAAAALLAAPPS